MGVGHTFPVSEPQSLQFALCQHLIKGRILQPGQRHAHLVLFRPRHPQPLAVLGGYLQKSLKIFAGVGPPADRQKIDQLDKQTSLTAAGLPHRRSQLLQALHVAVVGNAQQGSTGNITDTGRFNDNGTRPSLGKTPIPIQYLGGHFAHLIGTPGHHGRYPGALTKGQVAHLNRGKQAGCRSLLSGGPVLCHRLVFDPLLGFPHGLRTPNP